MFAGYSLTFYGHLNPRTRKKSDLNELALEYESSQVIKRTRPTYKHLKKKKEKEKNIYIKAIFTSRSESRTSIPKFEELDLSS